MSEESMESGRDPETLALFVEESLEGLQQIEQHLLAAERGQPAANMMGTLFRAVHTIKGTAGYLAYEKTQQLSHSAEDLLSRLRDNKFPAEPGHYASLVAVGDRLRQLIDNVKATGEEGPVEVASLVAQLQALIAAGENAVLLTASSVAQAVQNKGQSSIVPVAPIVAKPAPELPRDVSVSSPGKSPADAAAQARPHEEEVLKDRPVASKAEAADGTVRVNVAVLDRLMNLIGELVLARNQLAQVGKVIGDGSLGNQAVFQRLNVVTTELQEQVMKTRMQPVARVFEKIPRMVRDVARAVNKEVQCQIEGNATEIDKALVEAIRDPVMHIVRNALDHGIESSADRLKAGKHAVGTLSVRAAHKGGAVTIEIEDDGRGMDPGFIRAHAIRKGVLTAAEANRLSDRESLELVFRPGFSTAAQVTDISGRGVGMDVVRTHVEQAGGQAEIESVAGKGTTIRLKMPLTLAIIPALLVRVMQQRFAIPQVNLLELVYLTEEQRSESIETVRGADIHRLRGELLPVIYLRAALGLPERPADERTEGTYIVVLASGQRRYSLIVDAIDNTEEIVIKPLRGQLKRLTSYSGATVLGDGGVALILDVAGIASKAGLDLSAQRRADLAPSIATSSSRQSAMIFSCGGMQCAVPLAMVSRLEQVERNAIEQAAGQEVLQYRGSLLPIVRPEMAMGFSPTKEMQADQLLIVFDFGRPVALAVDSIIDVTEVDLAAVSLRDQTPFTSGKLIVLGKTTLAVDVFAIVQSLAPKAVTAPKVAVSAGEVLVVEPIDGLRGALVSYLQGSGYRAKGVDTVATLLKELKLSGPSKYSAALVAAEACPPDTNEMLQQIGRLQPTLDVLVGCEEDLCRARVWPQSERLIGFFDKGRREEALLLLARRAPKVQHIPIS